MSDTHSVQTSFFDNAHDRLAQAVARAEAAAGRLATNRAADAKALASIGDLQSALVAAQAENKVLRARQAAVTKRLEAAIDRLKTVLAESP